MGLPLAAIGLGIGAVKSLIGAGQAIGGARSVKRLKKEEPVYQIPKEVFGAQNIASVAAQVGMPETQYQRAVMQGNRNAQFALNAAQDRRSGLGAIERIQQSQNDYVLGLASQDAVMRQQNQRFLYSAMLNTANYRDKLFANQWQSWANKMQQARAQVGAGMQNVVGGLDSAAGVLINADILGINPFGTKKKGLNLGQIGAAGIGSAGQ